jgi:hypothetical protein
LTGLADRVTLESTDILVFSTKYILEECRSERIRFSFLLPRHILLTVPYNGLTVFALA